MPWRVDRVAPVKAQILIARALLSVWFATLLDDPVFAALGKTVDECRELYGRPPYGNSVYEVDPPARIKYFYVWQGIYVTAQFVGRDIKDSRCRHVTYMKFSKPGEPFEEMSKAEIDKILALNAAGKMWISIPGGWKRSDNRTLAVNISSGTANQAIIIFAADFYPKDSQAFAEVRASLSSNTSK